MGKSLVDRLREQDKASRRNGKKPMPKRHPAPRPEPWQPPIQLGDAPDPEPFPLDVLPVPLARFVRDGAVALACPPDYLGVPLLAIAGAAIGASRAVEIKEGWPERPSMYAAVVAPPGSAKSPALKLVARPVYAEQNRRFTHYGRQKMAHEEESDASSPKPILSTVYVQDITTEALAGVLRDNPRGVVLIRDELTAWVAALDQYRARGRGSDRQFFLSAWAGETVSVYRKTQDDGPVFVPHPFISVIGCLPPDLLFRLRGEKALADGFLDRILFSYPEPPPAVGENWACVSEEAVSAWAETLAFFWRMEQEPDDDGGKRPHFVRLDRTGRTAWVRFTCALADEMNRETFPACLRGPWAKLKGYCARLGLILHCLRLATGEVEAEDVDGESLDRAAALVRYFKSHARKVYAALEADSEVEDARRLLHWIARERRTEFKRWEVYNDVRSQGKFPRVEDLDKPLGRLCQHRFIRLQPPPERQGAGRPADPFYEVNPLWNHQENQANQANSSRPAD
jgi:hypothetical protein